MYENSTGDMRFTFTGLTPYTRYTVVVRAKAAGEVGPGAQDDVITSAEGEENTFAATHLFTEFDEYQGCIIHSILINQITVLAI